MSTDTQQRKEQYELHIQLHACISFCKECSTYTMSNGRLICLQDNPSPTNCSLLRVHGGL